MARTASFFTLLILLLAPAVNAAGSSALGPDSYADDEWHYTLLFPMVWAPDIRGAVDGGG